MSKKIASLGINLRLDDVDTLSFNGNNGLMDYDIVIVLPILSESVIVEYNNFLENLN